MELVNHKEKLNYVVWLKIATNGDHYSELNEPDLDKHVSYFFSHFWSRCI